MCGASNLIYAWSAKDCSETWWSRPDNVKILYCVALFCIYLRRVCGSNGPWRDVCASHSMFEASHALIRSIIMKVHLPSLSLAFRDYISSARPNRCVGLEPCTRYFLVQSCPGVHIRFESKIALDLQSSLETFDHLDTFIFMCGTIFHV